MAVYTEVTLEQLNQMMTEFDLGIATRLEGINGGIENTNYFVFTEKDGKQNEYVLTLFEELDREEIPFFVELGNWLAERAIPVSYAIPDKNGIGQKSLCGKAAIIQPRYQGHHLDREALNTDHCAQIGEALAKYHLAGADFYMQRQAHRGVFWWRRESSRLATKVSDQDRELLKAEVEAFDQVRSQKLDLPMGIIHGDLFHDNALFHDDKLVAILDIYNAATAYWLYDLAIVANDWCINADLEIDPARERALLEAYQAVRPFTDDERKVWPILTRTAAMRFWLSRLIPWIEAQEGISGKTIKDPDEYRKILQFRIANPAAL